jgi:peptidoglycan/xylan/chitin deacetylase (PgdA/CDA1 family)
MAGMSSQPVRLGCLILTAVLAAGVLAQTSSSPGSSTPAAQRPKASPTASRATQRPKPKATTAPNRSTRKTAHTQTQTSKQTRRRGQHKVLYLTFDDGPQHIWTPKVLEVLAKHDAKATFFALGKQVAEEGPELLRVIRAAGHTVGNHTYGHKHLTRLPLAQARWEIRHGPPSQCFRPPYRETNAQIAGIAASYGMRQVLWTVDTFDWEEPGADRIEAAIVNGAAPGAVILMHDGGGDRSQTVHALDRALTRLSAQGYTFRALTC